MKSQKTYLLILSILCVFTLKPYSLSAQKSEEPNEYEIIPPEFGKEGGVLLIKLSGSEKQRKILKKIAEEFYQGKFEFVTSITTKYKDIDTYRYVYGYRLVYTRIHVGDDYRPRFSFYVLDRKINKTHKGGIDVSKSLFKLMVKKHLRKLDKKRESYL